MSNDNLAYTILDRMNQLDCHAVDLYHWNQLYELVLAAGITAKQLIRAGMTGGQCYFLCGTDTAELYRFTMGS